MKNKPLLPYLLPSLLPNLPRYPLRYPALLACLLAGASAHADSTMMMPDGSREMYVGLAMAARTGVTPGDDRRTVLVLSGQVQWSNGIFLSANGVLGMQLSERPGIEYGPLLQQSNERHPGDSRRLAGTRDIAGTLDGGGFYNYYLGDDLLLRSSLVYNTSAGGAMGNVGLQKALVDVAPHHTLALSLSMNLAGGQVMRELYEVRPDAAAPDRPHYRPSAGVLSVNAGLNWNWALSSHWLVNSAVTATRLGPGPANSPVTARAGYLTWSTGLAYRF
ncbi:MAG: MipA/OmpV family protein [Pseudomonadota bacterium]